MQHRIGLATQERWMPNQPSVTPLAIGPADKLEFVEKWKQLLTSVLIPAKIILNTRLSVI